MDTVLDLIICMGSSLEWLPSVCVCELVCVRVETKRLKETFGLFFCCVLFLPPFVPSLMLFMPAYIYYLYNLSFFCHCNPYQQSRCLNNASPFSSFNHMYSFLPFTTVVCCHRGIHENFGDKAQTRSVRCWSQTRIQRAITQQSHTPRCTIMLRQCHALRKAVGADWLLHACCTLALKEIGSFFFPQLCSFFFQLGNDFDSTTGILFYFSFFHNTK